MGTFEDSLAALGPLRVRAQQLQVQAAREREAAFQRWSQSEKPVLKEHAAGMKETMQLLAKEEEALQQRVSSISASTIRNHPGTSTGFNVIRARVDALGRPLSTEALKTERDRLKRTLDTIDLGVAGAKAEINQHRRSDEAEIWETKLVALQDTKRVYLDEINIIEVELLGREHYERMQRDRQIAEETGAAQLQRLQENMLQTRVKYNRAKHQYYFPSHKGFNINFGGSGIYGACKDICISEIHGAMRLTMEPGGIGEDGMFHEGRMILQVEAPTNTSSSTGTATGTAAAAAQKQSTSPSKTASFNHRRSDTGNGSSGGGSGGAHVRPTSAPVNPSLSSPASTLRPTGSSSTSSFDKQQQLRRPSAIQSERVLHPGDGKSDGLARRSVSFPTASGVSSGGGGSSVNAAKVSSPSAASTTTAAPALPPLPPPPGGKPKGKGFASRFMNRLSNRKERFQGKELPHLQPARDEDDTTQRRSLASKLLSRKGSKRDSGVGLDRLAFGGHELTEGGQRGSMMSGSIDEDHVSKGLSGSVAGSDLDQDFTGLEAVLEGSTLETGPPVPSSAAVEEHSEGDGSLASFDDEDDDDEDEFHLTGGGGGGGGGNNSGSKRNGYEHHQHHHHNGDIASPLTKESLQRASSSEMQHAASRRESGNGAAAGGPSSSGQGSSWQRGGGYDVGLGADAMSVFDDGTSSVMDFGGGDDDDTEASAASAAGLSKIPKGVYVMGRLSGFELVGERGTKVPNLTIGRADLRATVFARFVFEYNKQAGWRAGTRPGDRPVFHVDKLKYAIRGNNVPMPQTLIKHILRMAIPGLIQRRLLALLPKEFGEYLLNGKKGLDVVADVGVVGPALTVLDADIGFEVRGPARSAKEARQQQALYAAAKEARNLLGLSLPQAQVLAELFNGSAALLEPKRPASISELIALQATYERFPKVYRQLCAVFDDAYQVLAQAQDNRLEFANFSFTEFMAGPVSQMRRKPARTRVVVRNMDVAVNADAVVTAIHDFTQRAIEEMIVKGPLLEPGATLHSMKESVADELEVLHAWHAFALRELQHFKSKFRGAAGTVLAAADCGGFSGGVENFYYEGPLRLRLPLNIQLDQDGAFSFEVPLPSPSGNLGIFMDNFKALIVPSHLRPPAGAINWVELTGDSAVDAKMKDQLLTALGLIQGVINELNTKIVQNGLEKDDEDAEKALTQPRTTIGDRLGRMFVNRLKVRVRLDERRIGEILSGIDGNSMGGEEAFINAAGRIISHLGDVMTLGLTPAGADSSAPVTSGAGPPPAPDRYLFHFESSDISRLRADVQSLGFQSSVTPGGMVRLVHAIIKAAQVAFLKRSVEDVTAFREQMEGWYNLLTREDLNVSVCLDSAGEVENNHFLIKLSGKAEETALRATSPLVLTNEIDLVPLGKAMRGDVDRTFPPVYREEGR